MTNTLAHPETADISKFTARFFHPEKAPAFQRRGLTAHDLRTVTAALAGCEPDELDVLQQQLADEVEQAALELLAKRAVADAVADLPFRDGETIVALGDSITDDALSWAHQLDHLLRHARPDLGVQVINAGTTGNTVLEAITRFDLIAAADPDWIIQLIGTNDARRHGAAASMPLASLEETRRNLGVLETLIAEETTARLVRMTPPPVEERNSDAWEPFQAESITWREADVEAIAALVQTIDEHAIDLHTAFRDGRVPLLLPDGVHPNLAGQQLIAETLITALPNMTLR